MSIICDTHLHSSFSGDSNASMESMVQAAVDKGLKEICFTEHQDFDFIYQEGEPNDLFEVNTDQYLYDLIQVKDKFAGKIDISFGIELGVQDHIARKLAVYSKSHDFDFIIASSHLCNHKDPYLKEFFEGRPEKEGYHEYFQYIAKCIGVYRNFDSYGHLDYVLRYGPNKNAEFSMKEYGDDIDVILKLLIDNEKALEVNSSGLSPKYGLGQPHPNIEILKRYKELGGELITIGSDAHTPDRIAGDYDKVEAILKECGYKYYAVFMQRMAEMFPL